MVVLAMKSCGWIGLVSLLLSVMMTISGPWTRQPHLQVYFNNLKICMKLEATRWAELFGFWELHFKLPNLPAFINLDLPLVTMCFVFVISSCFVQSRPRESPSQKFAIWVVYVIFINFYHQNLLCVISMDCGNLL